MMHHRSTARKNTPTATGRPWVWAGLDTHADSHTLAILDAGGGVITTRTFPTDQAGIDELVTALDSSGVTAVGIECTASYGATAAQALQDAGHKVLEVNGGHNRPRRRRVGKTDALDAIDAARAVMSGTGSPVKSPTGPGAALRPLRTARRAVIKARCQAINTIRSLLLIAPAPLRRAGAGTPSPSWAARLADAAADLDGPDVDLGAAITALARAVSRAYDDATNLTRRINRIITQAAPALLDIQGVAAITAADLLIAVGDNPQRLRSEASFAALAGTAPVPIRSGHSNHHRLSRGGDRALNRAIHTIVMVRKRRDATTRAYIQAHTAKGMTNRDITRRLKRAVARNLHHALKQALNNPTYHPTTLTPTT